MYLSFHGFIPDNIWSFAEKITEIENTACIGLVNGLFCLVMYKDRCVFYILNVRMWKKR